MFESFFISMFFLPSNIDLSPVCKADPSYKFKTNQKKLEKTWVEQPTNLGRLVEVGAYLAPLYCIVASTTGEEGVVGGSTKKKLEPKSYLVERGTRGINCAKKNFKNKFVNPQPFKT